MSGIRERFGKSVIIGSILLILLGGFSFFKGAELLEETGFYKESIETLDEKRGNVMGMTAALVGTSTLITGLPDDMGTPVAEQLMDMTDWLLLVLCVVFLEKYGMAMLWAVVFKGLIPAACILGIADLVGVKWDVRRIWQKLAVLSVVLAVTIPLGVYASGMIEKTYETSITALAEEGDELAQMMEAQSPPLMEPPLSQAKSRAESFCCPSTCRKSALLTTGCASAAIWSTMSIITLARNQK